MVLIIAMTMMMNTWNRNGEFIIPFSQILTGSFLFVGSLLTANQNQFNKNTKIVMFSVMTLFSFKDISSIRVLVGNLGFMFLPICTLYNS